MYLKKKELKDDLYVVIRLVIVFKNDNCLIIKINVKYD